MTKNKSNPKISRENLRKAVDIFRYIKPYKAYFLLGLTLLVIGSLVFMGIPALAGEMANAAIGESRFSFTVNQYALVLMILILVQGVFSYLRTVSFAIVSEKGMADVRKDLYDTLICQSYSSYEQERVGELTSRLTTDVEKLQTAFSVTLAEFLRQIVILISGIAILAYLTPKLSLTMLLTFPIIVVLAVVFGRFIRKISRKRQDVLAEANTIVEETLQSFSAVKAYANEWYESARYANSIDEIVKISLNFARIRGVFFIFIITILFGGIIFILWRGALLVESGDMAIGDLFSFIIYTGILGGAIAGLGNLYTTLAGAIGATERVQDMLEREKEVQISESGKKDFSRIKGGIRFEKVQFSYPTREDVEVLKEISFSIPEGHKVALVGQSGAGKSTIVQLLMRFYNLSKGGIYINGNDISQFNISAYRKNIGIVPQEVILFGGTIRENILYGKPDANEQELQNAIEQSYSKEFIENFPEGLETLVGERGIKLSGGQRQRIAIARAILKNPGILILDEATSSLDAESEKYVQEALDYLMRDRTSIIIAHRLSTIKYVDRIYVLDKGSILEQGTHDELIQMENGLYNSLAKLQFGLH